MTFKLSISSFDPSEHPLTYIKMMKIFFQPPHPPPACSLLGLLQDGAHGRDDRGLGASGGGRHGDHCGQRCSGGDDGGLGQGHRNCRVPFALPLLSICWGEETNDAWSRHTHKPMAVRLPVAVVVLVLLAVEAAVLEGLVPFLVPVTNSICGTKTYTEVD